MTQPEESRIPLLTPRCTHSTGPALGGLPLPARTSSHTSNQGLTDVPFSWSVIFAQNNLAQLSAIEEQQEAERLQNHTILTPASPQTVAEPSPQQAFQPQFSSTPTPHMVTLLNDEQVKGFYRGSTLPGTPFRGPYPSFDLAWD